MITSHNSNLSPVNAETLHVPLAVLDANGMVTQVNDAWQRPVNQDECVDLARCGLGASFLDFCRSEHARWRASVADGVEDVLQRKVPGFRHEYILRSITRRKRFALLVVPREASSGGAFVFHFEITNTISPDDKVSLVDWVFDRCLSDILIFEGTSLKFLQASDGAQRNLGFDSSELEVMTLLDIEPGLTEASLRERLQPLIDQQQEKIDYDTTFRRRNGSLYPVHVHAQCVMLDERMIHFVIAQDLTRGTATEQLLTEVRAVLESTPDAMVIVDDSGTIKAANSRMATFFGYRLDELHGMCVDTLLPARLRGEHASWRDGFSTRPKHRGFSAQVGFVAQTKDAREVPVEVSLNPVPGRDGVLIAAAIRDSRHDAGAVRLLEESDARYRGLFDNATDIIHIVAPDGSLTYVNASWQRALGYSADEAGRMKIFDLIHPDERAQAKANFDKVMRGQNIECVRRRLITRDDEVRVFEGGASCQMRGTQVVAACSIMHDVTDQDVVERKLKAAKDAAEHSTAAKSRFLAAASHDLRQPLQSLGLYLAVLRRRSSEPAVADIGSKMQISVDAMAVLLDALLDISRFEAGAIAPNIAGFELQSLLKTVVTDNVQQAQQKGIALICEKVNVRVRTDEALLVRIVENFVTNAIRYTSDGSVEIKVRQSDCAVTISVQDSGIGIAEDAIDKIFEEYYQIQNPSRDTKRGLGLGLSIVRYIAQLLDLPLEVCSTPDVGSTFSVAVPLDPLTELPSAARTHPQSVKPGCAADKVVLLVDDDPTVLDATATLLRSVDFDVHAASSAEAALDLVGEGLKPSFLLTDFRLPGASGAILVEDLRDALGATIPSIIMTGDTTIRDGNSSKLDDCEVLQKPVDTEYLLRIIAQRLAGRGSH